MKKKIVTTKDKTAGQIIEEHTAGKQLDDTTPAELGSEMLSQFEGWMTEWIKEGRKVFDGDFFVVLNLKVEKSLNNTPHLIPECRQTCPDPFYDQSVWKYERDPDKLEFLWTIPDLGTTKLFRDDPLHCPPDQVQLRGFVLDYVDGTLQKKANGLNEDILRSTNGRTK